MSDTSVFDQPLVFGLDIGTRNVVGTVGYKTENEFVVVAQYMLEHETRAMLDGQIHDIGRVGHTIAKVKEELESQIGQELTEVCIAAAGRVLKTVTTNISYDFPEETVVTGEDIHTLDLLGIEKAQSILKEMNDTRYKFYCVGYSTVKFFLNDEVFISLEGHKANKIGEDIIVTFLPEDVVDGLYAAQILKFLEGKCRKAVKYVFPAGEEHKNLDTVKDILKFFGSEEGQRIQGESGAAIPAYQGLEDTWAGCFAEYPINIQCFIEMFEYSIQSVNNASRPEWKSKVNDELLKIYAGTEDIETGLQKMQDIVDQASAG